MSMIEPSGDRTYQDFLQQVTALVRQSRIGVARSVNRELIRLYWALGQYIVEQQDALGWGKAVVERLSVDLKTAFPEMGGFSPQNLWLIRQFYVEYEKTSNLQQLVGEIPWGHNVLIMQRIKDESARRYYLEATMRLGWTRNVLLNQIKAGAFEMSLQDKSHNFAVALPEYLAEQAEEMLKSRYSLEFLGLTRAVHERRRIRSGWQRISFIRRCRRSIGGCCQRMRIGSGYWSRLCSRRIRMSKTLLDNLARDLRLQQGWGFSRSTLTAMRQLYFLSSKSATVSQKFGFAECGRVAAGVESDFATGGQP